MKMLSNYYAPDSLYVEYYSTWWVLWYNGFIEGNDPDENCPFPL